MHFELLYSNSSEHYQKDLSQNRWSEGLKVKPNPPRDCSTGKRKEISKPIIFEE
jgi:hypothetical protein